LGFPWNFPLPAVSENKGPKSLEERDLVGRLLQREPQAEQWYVDAHRDKLYRAAVYFLGYRDPEAEDVVQETLAQGLDRLTTFEHRSSLYTWLNQICVHLCYRRLRARQRLALGAETDLRESLDLPGQGPDALGQLLGEERRAQVQKALAGMEEPCRDLIARRDLQGASYQAVARGLRIPIGTVMSRLSRCRKKLKDVILRMGR
jgi:RNA polymerase sigma-70 factor (ECF subfamily)